MSRTAVAGVDDAEAVAVRVGEHDEVGVVGVEVPVDALGAQGYQALDLRGLVGGVTGVQVQMNPRMLLGRGRAQAE